MRIIVLASACILCTPAWGQSAPAIDVSLQEPMVALQSAWNHGDGAAWGNAFAPEADSINVYGTVIHGSAAIGARHAGVFAGRMKGTTMTSALLSTRRLGNDAAVLGLTQDIAIPAAGETPPRTIRVFATLVTERRGGVWKIVQMQNTSVVPPPAEH